MLKEILTCISIITIMLLLKSLVAIFPSLIACLVRYKECFNLEASVKLSRNRDLMTIAMILPFCIIADSLGIMPSLPVTIGVFAAYIMLRDIVYRIFRSGNIPKMTYHTAGKAAHTFFIIMTLAILTARGILSLTGTDESVINDAIIWISTVIYCIFMFRKLQIFTASCSIFTAFLYLCALEIIPTGTLIVSTIIF